ncbi:hypothetical protein ACKI10_43365 [Streptomyces galilaeus]|uniref:hypothetical protein n=1 Tax=Streptomyces TaxID=1883 RepID=UPI0034DE9495
MADLTTTRITAAAGLLDLAAAATAAAVGGDTAEVGPRRFLYVNNGGAGSVTVTVATPGTAGGFAIADGTYAVAAGKQGLIPLSNDFRGSNGRAAITYSAVTTVTVRPFELPAA